MNGKRRNIWAVVLAGGDGQRLGALTRNAYGVCTPKQYCSLNGGHSLLQLSLQRALAVTTRKHIVTVVTEVHRRWWEGEFLGLPYSPLVVQPCNRGTGFGVLLPLLVIARSDPDAGVILIPSDHYVEHEDFLAEFLRYATAPETLDSDKLTLLGITPNAPDTGFGYLSPAPDSGIGMRPVHQFIEKPDVATATELIRSGGVWNSGIVAGRVSQFLALYPEHTRQMLSDLTAIVEDWLDSRIPPTELAILYARHRALDFSQDVLENRPENLQFLTVPPCGWNDVGTPARLAQALRTARPSSTPATTSERISNLKTAFDRANLATKPPRDQSAIINQPTFLQRGSALAGATKRCKVARRIEIAPTVSLGLKQMLPIDKLTRLYNRKGFVRACRHFIANLDGHSSSAMLLSINLAHLKCIEYALGLGIAEDMLKRTAEILLDVFQDTAVIGRWNTDHFVLLSVAAPEQCNALVRSLHKRIDAANASESRIRLNLSGQFRLIDLIAHGARFDRSDRAPH